MKHIFKDIIPKYKDVWGVVHYKYGNFTRCELEHTGIAYRLGSLQEAKPSDIVTCMMCLPRSYYATKI